MPETELKIKAVAEGTQQTAAELGKVAEAQENVAHAHVQAKDAAEAARPAHEALAEAQSKLAEAQRKLEEARKTGTVFEVAEFTEQVNKQEDAVRRLGGAQDQAGASERDWIGVLRQISPALGEFVHGAVQAAKVTQELAGAGKAWSAVGAAVIPVVLAITATLAAMAREFLEATEAINKQSKALDELASKHRDAQRDIAVRRGGTRLPVFSPEELQSATQAAQRVQERFPFIDEASAREAASLTGGAAGTRGGGTRSIEDIARVSRLVQEGELQPKEHASADSVQHAIDQALVKFRDRLDREFATQSKIVSDDAARAHVEVAQQGGSTLNLRDRLQRRAPAGSDIDHLVELAQSVGGAGGNEFFDKMLQEAIEPKADHLIRGVLLHILRRASQGAGLIGIDAGRLDPRLTATESDYAVLRGMFAELTAELKRASPVNINSYMPNARIIGPSARYQNDANVRTRMLRNAEFR